MTGRKVDFKREYALTFGEYVEARDPKVVSNLMAPRTEPCFALYPTLNANGSWKLYNIKTKKLVTRSQYIKVKCTPDNIINTMNLMAEKGQLKASDIDQVDPIDVELEQGNVNEPPAIVTHQVDPNVVEILQEESDEESDDESVVEAVAEEAIEPIIEPVVEEDEDEEEIETLQGDRTGPQLDKHQSTNLMLC